MYPTHEVVALTLPFLCSVKCEDPVAQSTPTWSVDGDADHEDVGSVKTVADLGLSVLSLHWSLLNADMARVRCRVRRQGWGRRCGASHLVRTVERPGYQYQEEEDYYYK